MKQDKRKEKIQTTIKKASKIHGKTLDKLGGGVDDKFIVDVNAFIEKYRGALKRLAKK